LWRNIPGERNASADAANTGWRCDSFETDRKTGGRRTTKNVTVAKLPTKIIFETDFREEEMKCERKSKYSVIET